MQRRFGATKFWIIGESHNYSKKTVGRLRPTNGLFLFNALTMKEIDELKKTIMLMKQQILLLEKQVEALSVSEKKEKKPISEELHKKRSEAAKKALAKRWGKKEETIKEKPKSNAVAVQTELLPLVVEEKKEVIKRKTLEERKVEFIASVDPYRNKYGDSMIEDFILYWSEENTKTNKMRYEMQPTWSLGGRLSRWARNNFNNQNNNRYGKSEDQRGGGFNMSDPNSFEQLREKTKGMYSWITRNERG